MAASFIVWKVVYWPLFMLQICHWQIDCHQLWVLTCRSLKILLMTALVVSDICTILWTLDNCEVWHGTTMSPSNEFIASSIWDLQLPVMLKWCVIPLYFHGLFRLLLASFVWWHLSLTLVLIHLTLSKGRNLNCEGSSCPLLFNEFNLVQSHYW